MSVSCGIWHRLSTADRGTWTHGHTDRCTNTHTHTHTYTQHVFSPHISSVPYEDFDLASQRQKRARNRERERETETDRGRRIERETE